MKLELRDKQPEIISEILKAYNDGYKVVVLNSPTGSGKSIINAMVTKHLGTGYTTTPLRTLVDQYKETIQKFEEENLGWVVMGRGAYPCLYSKDREEKRFQRLNPDEQYNEVEIRKHEFRLKNATADGAECTQDNPKYFIGKEEGEKKYEKECPFRGSCPYYLDRDRAMMSLNAFSTFDYFMHGIYRQMLNESNEQAQKWGERDILTIDEAHFLPNKLVDFFALTITEKSLPGIDYKLIIKNINEGRKNLKPGESFNHMVAEKIREVFDPYMQDEEDKLRQLNYEKETEDEDNPGVVIYNGKETTLDDAIQRQRKFTYKLAFVRRSIRNDVEFVYYHDEDGLYLKPYSAKAYVSELWEMFDYILLSSATFFDVPTYLDDLGLSGYKWKEIQVPSPFNAEDGPIIKATNLHLSMKTFDQTIGQVVKEIDAIMESHPNERGMIHCFSGKYRKEIWERTKYRNRMLIHDSYNRSDVLREFTSNVHEGDNRVLLSVNMGEGVDLKDELARFQIIVKAPFLPMGDPWIALHKERSEKWYRNQTIIELMQMSGRVVRSKEDYGFTYLIDANAWDLLRQVKHDLPVWFSEKMDAGERERERRMKVQMNELLGE